MRAAKPRFGFRGLSGCRPAIRTYGELKREADMLDGSIGEERQEFQKISRSVAKTELDEVDIEAGEGE